MRKVKLTVVSSNCRCGHCKAGDEFIVEDLLRCPDEGRVVLHGQIEK